MNKVKNPDTDRKPDLSLGVLKVWVHKRQYPDAIEFRDANWLYVTAHCGAKDSEVWVTEPMLHLTDLDTLQRELSKFKASEEHKLRFEPTEPNLSIEFKGGQKEIEVRVHITPDVVEQQHTYWFIVEGNELTAFMEQVKRVREQYPIIGDPE